MMTTQFKISPVSTAPPPLRRKSSATVAGAAAATETLSPPKKKSRSLRVSTEPIPISGRASKCRTPSICVHDYDNDGDDDVFESSQKIGKENQFLVPLSSPRWPLASPETPVGICVNSPGRRALQKRSLDSISDLQFLGKGGFGSVVLGLWKGRKVAVKVLP